MSVDATAAIAAKKQALLDSWEERLGKMTPGQIDLTNPAMKTNWVAVLRAYADSLESDAPIVWPAAVDTFAQNKAESQIQGILDELTNG